MRPKLGGGLLLYIEYIRSDQMQYHLEIGTLLNEGSLSSQLGTAALVSQLCGGKYKLNTSTWAQEARGPGVQGYWLFLFI